MTDGDQHRGFVTAPDLLLKHALPTACGAAEAHPLEFIHRLGQQIPAPHQHLVRYYAHYSNRSRGARAAPGQTLEQGPVDVEDDSPELRTRRRSWARLLPKIFEVDPLLCPKCQSAFATAREIAGTEGVWTGPSGGANIRSATRLARELGPGRRVVTVQPDSGLKYLAGDLYR